MSIISHSENSLKMVKGLIAKTNYNGAIKVCNQVIDDLKEVALNQSYDSSDIQLIAVALGELSEIYEKKEEFNLALEYTKLQKLFLSFVKWNQDIDEDKYQENIRQNRIKLIKKLDEIRNMNISLSTDPEEAMKQIMESLNKSKKQRINDMLESINQANKTERKFDDIKLNRQEKIFNFIFDHPFIIAFSIIFFLFLSVWLIMQYYSPNIGISDENKKKIMELNRFAASFEDPTKNDEI